MVMKDYLWITVDQPTAIDRIRRPLPLASSIEKRGVCMYRGIDYQQLLEEIQADVLPLIPQGKVADYIPRLAAVPLEKFGMAVRTNDGTLYTVGDAEEPFSIQSISKAFTLTLAFSDRARQLWKRVGREPSGTAFNSLIQLEHENGIPRNPFINAGALIVTDIIAEDYPQPDEKILSFVQHLADNPTIHFDADVAESEKSSGYRNAALANFLKSFDNLRCPVEQVLDLYFLHCSLSMNCVDLVKGFSFLANGGRLPWLDEKIVEPYQAKRINALMMTCGTYDAVGDFAYRVGMPAKSGVGGGIVAVIPGQLTVAVWSPGLNSWGNSLVGTKALELFTTRTGLSVF
jgi:glutaminase